MQVRYRYRLYPGPGQQQALARVFGCARDVYNDCLRVRDEAHAAGEKISGAEMQRRLRRAQRVLSRRQKGSANRARARHRVAVLHRTARETRLDHAHKTALRLVRDNQAVYAEDLAVSGPIRTRLAKSVADAAGPSCCDASRRKQPSTAARSPGSAGSSPPARCARPAA